MKYEEQLSKTIKVLEKGGYFKFDDDEIIFYKPEELCLWNFTVFTTKKWLSNYTIELYSDFEITEYGTKFALTKEELENENKE